MLKHSLFIALSSATAQAIVALLYIAVARQSGPADLGGVVAAIAAATFIAGAFDFGTNNLWVREVAAGKMPYAELSTRISYKILYIFLVAALLVAGAVAFLPRTDYYATGILAFSMAFYQSMLVPLKAAAAGGLLAVVMLLERVVAAICFAAFWFTGFEAPSALVYSLALGSVIAGAVSFIISAARHHPPSMFTGLIWPWKGSLSYGVGGLTLSAQTLDATLLYAVAGPTATGVYGAVNRWTQPLGVFANAFATAGIPHVAKSQSLRASYPTLRRAWWLLAIAASMCLLVAILSPLVVTILLGEDFRDSANVLTILALGTIPALANQPLYVFMQAMKLDRSAAMAVMASVGLQLSLCAMLGFQYGAVGAALALAVSQSTLLATFAFILIRRRDV
ncbi:lipopolysaccharide biosynthesis protein [Kocuria sp. M4R2S49]|uniref:lipopolysaccharide biosynthesis protein n=1 Tax=Kocuria rhizosphaericola TaxID=3376284 RepID=UPI00378DA9A0